MYLFWKSKWKIWQIKQKQIIKNHKHSHQIQTYYSLTMYISFETDDEHTIHSPLQEKQTRLILLCWNTFNWSVMPLFLHSSYKASTLLDVIMFGYVFQGLNQYFCDDVGGKIKCLIYFSGLTWWVVFMGWFVEDAC